MKELKQYYRQIKCWLPCGGLLKKQLMANITATVEAYLAENPEADFPALQARFGTPQQIATAFVDEMDTAELLSKLKIRRHILQIVLVCASIALILWILSIIFAWIESLFGYTITKPPIILK